MSTQVGSHGVTHAEQFSDYGPCYLLELPPELRILIYERLMYVEPLEGTGLVHLTKKASRAGKTTVLNILGACRQIYKEAVSIFYRMNAIHLQCYAFRPLRAQVEPYILTGFLTATRLARRSAIRNLCITAGDIEDVIAILKQARRLPNLQALTFLLNPNSLWHVGSRGNSLQFLKQAVENLESVESLSFRTNSASYLPLRHATAASDSWTADIEMMMQAKRVDKNSQDLNKGKDNGGRIIRSNIDI